MGDFYMRQRGRMQGDPGFFSFLGGLAKKAAGFIPGAGPAVSGVLEGITSHGGERQVSLMRRGGRAAIHIPKKHPVMTAGGAAGSLGRGARRPALPRLS